MAGFYMLPLVRDCVRMPWRVSCMLFSKTSVGESSKKLKKPQKPFQIFKNELAEELKTKNPSIESKDILSTAKDCWKKLSAEAKEKYVRLFESSVEEYIAKKGNLQVEIADYLKVVKEKRAEKIIFGKRLASLKKPKKPLPPFFIFLEKCRHETPKKPNEDNAEFATRAGQMWIELSDGEKEKYKHMYLDMKKQFFKDLENWEQEMIQKGNLDVIRLKTLEKITPKHVNN